MKRFTYMIVVMLGMCASAASMNLIEELDKMEHDLQERQREKELKFFYMTLNHSVESMQKMMQSGINVNIHDDAGDTPLMCATLINSLEKVKFLLNAGADIDAKNKLGQTAQDWARSFGYKEISDYFEQYQKTKPIKIFPFKTSLK